MLIGLLHHHQDIKILFKLSYWSNQWLFASAWPSPYTVVVLSYTNYVFITLIGFLLPPLPSRRHRNHLKSRDQQSLTLRSPVAIQGLLFVNFCHQRNWEFVLFLAAPPIVTVSCRTNFQSTMKICFASSDSSYTLNPAYLEHQPACEDVTTTQDPRTNGFSKGNISKAKCEHKRCVYLKSKDLNTLPDSDAVTALDSDSCPMHK